MRETRDPLEYVLNRMEFERDKKPPTVGYPPARKELLDGIAALRAEVAALRGALRSLARIETDEEGLPVLVISCGWHCQTSDQTELPLVWAALSRPVLPGNGGKP